MNEEHGERFHQDIKVMEARYQGQWDVAMMADYCWCLKRNCERSEMARESKRRKYIPHTSKTSFSVIRRINHSITVVDIFTFGGGGGGLKPHESQDAYCH